MSYHNTHAVTLFLMLWQTSTSSSSACDLQPLYHDAVASPPLAVDGETLVPSVPDVLISMASFPESTADRVSNHGSAYVSTLLKHLRPAVDVKEALTRVNQLVRQLSPHAKSDVVSTMHRPLVFPHRK